MKEIVFLLEEPSAREMLKGLLPRILDSQIDIKYLVFEGKSDLEKRVARRIQSYMKPNTLFIVMRDQDSGDCVVIKQRLIEKIKNTGKPFFVRILCRELESWYLADLAAVEKGLEVTGLSSHQNRETYRSPDVVQNPAMELARIAPTYQKVGGSRAIGPYLDINNNRSKSFSVFVRTLQQISQPAA